MVVDVDRKLVPPSRHLFTSVNTGDRTCLERFRPKLHEASWNLRKCLKDRDARFENDAESDSPLAKADGGAWCVLAIRGKQKALLDVDHVGQAPSIAPLSR